MDLTKVVSCSGVNFHLKEDEENSKASDLYCGFDGDSRVLLFNLISHIISGGVRILNHDYEGPRPSYLTPLGFVFCSVFPIESSPIWDEQPYFDIQIPRTGTTSRIYSLDHKSSFGHVYARNYPRKVHPKLKTIVRNPFSRLVSAYNFMKGGGFNKHPEYLAITRKYPTFEEFVLGFLNTSMFSLKYVQHYPLNGYEVLLRQYDFLVDASGKMALLPENIGRFENRTLSDGCETSYEKDIERLYSVKMTVHYSKTTSDINDWKTYYTNPDVVKIVGKAYKKDFHLLGYSNRIEDY